MVSAMSTSAPRYAILLNVLLLCVWTMWQVAASQPAPQGSAKDSDKGSEKVLRHIVMYKFKPEISAGQVREVVDTFAALPKKIDVITAFEHGTNVSPEGKSEGFTHCFVVTFKDEAGRETYLKHPAHLEYVNVVKDRREKVIVFDYWAKP